MTRIIPRELIRHLEWEPGKEVPERKPVVDLVDDPLSIDELVNEGKIFYSEEKDSSGNYIGVRVALQEALDMGEDVLTPSMPQLMAGRVAAPKENYLWKHWWTCFSEENAGIDREGKFGRKDKPVVITLHGGGILSTPERIQQAYDEGLTPQHAAKYTNEEMEALLAGELLDGTRIPLYAFDDFRVMEDVPARYGVITEFDQMKKLESGSGQKIRGLYDNPLVIARSGGIEHARAYLDKCEEVYGKDVLGNWHPFKNADPNQAQGRLLFLGDYGDGLLGLVHLDYDGRFVGVAPEAHAAR